MQYYVIKNNITGHYWRGRGSNAWGTFLNQSSIYRVLGQAKFTKKELELKGFEVSIIPIDIFEGNPITEE